MKELKKKAVSRTCSFLFPLCHVLIHIYICDLYIYIYIYISSLHVAICNGSLSLLLCFAAWECWSVSPQRNGRERGCTWQHKAWQRRTFFLFLVLVFLEEKKGKTTLFFLLALPPLLRYEQVDTNKKKKEKDFQTHTHTRVTGIGVLIEWTTCGRSTLRPFFFFVFSLVTKDIIFSNAKCQPNVFTVLFFLDPPTHSLVYSQHQFVIILRQRWRRSAPA